MAKSQARIRRLEVLAALRKLYRNLLRAEGLLAQPEPIYQRQSGGLCGSRKKGSCCAWPASVICDGQLSEQV